MIRSHLLLCLLLFVLTDAVFAAPVDPQEATETHLEALLPDPAVRYGALENGLRYAILENDTPSGAGALWLHFDVGSLHEADDQRGLAHFLEHMAFNGSENVPEGEMVAILERHGLAFGADTNAFTSFDQTVYRLDLPSVDDETLDAAFFLFRQTADRLTIAQEAVDRERGVILSEKRTRDTPDFRALEAQWAFLYDGVRFIDRMPIGTVEVIENAPAERLRALYEDYYRPERAFLVFVGDADPDAIEARIQTQFADWAPLSAAGEDPAPGSVLAHSLSAGFYHDPDVRPSLTLSAVRDAYLREDDLEARKGSLMRWIGNAILTRRLQRLSREDGAVILNGQAGFTQHYDAVDAASITVLFQAERWRDSLQLAEQELRRALEHGFTDAELSEQLAIARNAFETNAARAATRRSAALAERLVSAFNDDEVFTHPIRDLAQFQGFAHELTLDAVEAAFAAQWVGVQPKIFLSTNAPLDNAQAEMLAAYSESQAAPVDAPTAAAALEFAYVDFGTPGEVVQRREIGGVGEDLAMTQLLFDNGVRLNLMPTPFEADRVRLSVRVGGGVLELPLDLPGLNTIASQSFIAGGLDRHGFDDLQTLLAGRSVGLGFGVGEDAFVFSAAPSPDELELQLQLFAAYLTAPGYRTESLTQLRQAIESVYDTLDATPSGVFQRDGARLLRSGDVRYGLAAKPDLLARDLSELEAVLDRALSSGAIEIGIVGDIEPSAAIDAVARTFAALPQRELTPLDFDAARTVEFPTATETRMELFHAGEADRGLIFIAWPTTDDRDARTARQLALLARVLQLKLTERVREAEGASYSPSAFSTTSSVHPGYGYIGASFELEPGLVDRFFDVVDEIAAGLAAGDISQDELERARDPLLEGIEESFESNGYWLSLAAAAQTRTNTLERHNSRRSDFTNIAVDDLAEVASRFLVADAAWRLAILPMTEPQGERADAETGTQ